MFEIYNLKQKNTPCFDERVSLDQGIHIILWIPTHKESRFQVSIEKRIKNPRILSIESWLFHRDSCHGFL